MQGAASTKPSFSEILARAKVMGRRYLVVLKKYWWIPIAAAAAGLVIGGWKGMNVTSSYISNSQMIISGQFNIEGSARVTETGGETLGSQFALITSPQVAERAKARLSTQHPDWVAVPVKINVNQVPHTSFLDLTAVGLEPLYTQAFLDSVMQEYMVVRKEMRKERSDTMTSAISSELLELDKKTNDHEQDVMDYQKENKIGFVQSQHNYAAETVSRLENELATMKTELNTLDTLSLDQNIDLSEQQQQKRAAMEQQAARSGSGGLSRNSANSMGVFDTSFVINNGNAMAEYQAIKQKVFLLKSQRDDLLKVMRAASPYIKEIEAKIGEAEQLMQWYKLQCMDLVKMRRDALEIRIKSKQSDIHEWSLKAMELSQKLAEYDRLKLKVDHDRKQYDSLITSMQSIDLYKNVEQETLSILSYATPAVEVKASVWKIVFNGLLSGLFAGLAILFLIDKTDDRIGSGVECQAKFREYPILGQIPHENVDGPLSLLVPYDPRKQLLEAFRALRSSILYAPMEGTRPKALMISSAAEDEGKTTIASNFAATLAFSGAKTLLVDCNLTDGRLHELFETSPDKGLINVLQQQVPWNEAVVQTDIDNLFLLPRGEALAYPAEHYFGAFLKDVYQEFDFIIFDSAPVLGDVDALSFAPVVDGLLFVIRFGKTSATEAGMAMKDLNARQVNVLGMVCNDV